MSINTKFKDSVFCFLFSDPNILRGLYSALTGKALPSDIPVEINTLHNVVFKGLYNDISFTIDGKLVVLIEHQSTINPNMALRLLMYIARVYEKIAKGSALYSNKLITIPRPEFFVLYNGLEPYPDEQIVHLSDAFEQSTFIPGTSLELEVRVLNINHGRNVEKAALCKELAEYSEFIAQARTFDMEIADKEKALKTTIHYCINHDILKEFLEKHSSEVLNMLMTEWNWDDALAVRYSEGIEQGIETAARNALAKGVPLELIQDITGLDIESIQKIQQFPG